MLARRARGEWRSGHAQKRPLSWSGGRGIRTPGPCGPTVFKTVAFVRSAIPPGPARPSPSTVARRAGQAARADPIGGAERGVGHDGWPARPYRGGATRARIPSSHARAATARASASARRREAGSPDTG